ncbi:MAG TPA: GFA family protein [Hypericibacter adhaerens]|uniref:Aldehyde-activating protein n=1 Tax=Hypericibacter adhaerens TaxID=2602016 RepID=A0A5J6N0K4_9PROT|nr:GFA family protein [Hypericibacter adhaerens]QEX23512.1 aldehyde-activating protein [Hypericibacter adhaerens]HWA45690.1 GFA family protein [Hypericibacter adhaerens]
MTDSSKPSVRQLAGKCYCGAVEYEVADAFRYAMNCHCSQCRRTTGSAFKPFAGIERAKLTVAAGADKLLIVGEPDGHDAHCRLCGSLLYSVVREGAFVHVAMGTLTDDPGIRPSKHIFVGSKAPWFTITDDLPQHEEF